MGLDFVPKPILHQIVCKMMDKMADQDVAAKVQTWTKEADAEGRSIKLDVQGQGTYCFILMDGRIIYVKEGLNWPLTEAHMSSNTFLDIYERKTTPMREWKHGFLQFIAYDHKVLYHINNLTDLLNRIREIMNM